MIKFNVHPCSVCGLTGHSKRGFYEIIGYPDWWKDFRNRLTDQTKEGDETQALGLLTTTGTYGKALHYVSVSNNTWVIDSSATDHMTFDSKQVTHLPCHLKPLFLQPMVLLFPLWEKIQSLYRTP